MNEEYDFIVIGSGAGGGPVAANLAQAGFSVLLLEAGGETKGEAYAVPGFHAQATQETGMRWDYWVRHFEDLQLQQRDTKYYDRYPETTGDKVDGVLYPRAAGLGGCTTHHALITVYPHDSDWRKLQELTGDAGWAPEQMRKYFQRIERCQYAKVADETLPARHGFRGWLPTKMEEARDILVDGQLTKLILSAALETLIDAKIQKFGSAKNALMSLFGNKTSIVQPLLNLAQDPTAALKHALQANLDPNDASLSALGHDEGLFQIPVSVDVDGTNVGVRCGSRERILQVKTAHPENLTIRTNCFAKQILFDGKRAIGVRYVQGESLYQAATVRGNRPTPGPDINARARCEVIVACGAFNTPQLLMLSGIGPKDQLTAHGIAPVLPNMFWEGVGMNLQDRYEIGVVVEMKNDFTILRDCTYQLPADPDLPDPCLASWRKGEKSLYAGNGAVIAVIQRSQPNLTDPDLFLFALPVDFRGYFPDYDERLLKDQNGVDRRNHFTWAILKAHTKSRGRVTLASADPFARPKIDFAYFQGPGADEDLNALLDGVKFVRRMISRPSVQSVIRSEDQPGPALIADNDIKDWIKAEAWGHHACGTCRIGRANDPSAVLNSDLSVRGLDGLRVVDASVFPEIPGFFIVTPIYMMAEKASADILRKAGVNSLPSVNWVDLPQDYWKA